MKHPIHCCCDITIHGLHKWYAYEFKKLGWMILAKERGEYDKIVEYKSSLQRLKRDIIHRMSHTHDKDRKEDFEIMCQNLHILMDHVDKDFD
jgi:hypothetical protein